MSKHGRFQPQQPQQAQGQTQQPRPGEVSTTDRSPRSMASVKSVVTSANEHERQDEAINKMEADGYRHYESLIIPGNMMILRFRRPQCTPQ